MQLSKQKKLEEKGWKIGTSSEFLELTSEEEAYLELKLSLCKSLKQLRTKKHLSQNDLAKLMKSSQSRVAKIEAGDPSVSIDLVIRSLLSAGASNKDLAKTVASAA
jgi:DNA-binding XRE family transcriptional regulator